MFSSGPRVCSVRWVAHPQHGRGGTPAAKGSQQLDLPKRIGPPDSGRPRALPTGPLRNQAILRTGRLMRQADFERVCRATSLPTVVVQGTGRLTPGSLTRLTTYRIVAKMVNMKAMKATLITSFKDVTPEGGVIELVVWRVPKPVPGCTHGFKYRAAYSMNGRRVIGFDNERGKGDHCHIDKQERPYQFSTVEQLVEDFVAAVETARRIK